MATSPSRGFDPATPAAPGGKGESHPSSPTASGHTLVNQHHLYWEMHGPREGPGVILLHQGLGSVGDWRHQVNFLARHGWSVLAYDRWGYGRSDPRPFFQDDFQDDDAEEAAQLLAALDIEGATLIGHSDGGSIALVLAARYPRLVRRLLLVAAHIYLDPKNAKTLSELPSEVEKHALFRALQRAHGQKAEQLYRAWHDCWVRPARADFNIEHHLANIKCPTFVIAGEDDPYVSNAHAQRLADGVEDATLWLIPEVGHMPPLEIPHTFNQRVLAFLEECG